MNSPPTTRTRLKTGKVIFDGIFNAVGVEDGTSRIVTKLLTQYDYFSQY